jgi:DNA modification methylase
MKIERINVAELSLDPSNVRKHDRKNLDAIKASLRKFGQQKPIVVDAKGIVLAGNGTLTAAKELGWTEIEITRTTLQGVEATAFAIADNRSAELAEWEDSLADVLKSLADANIDLADLGFAKGDLDKISKDFAGDSAIDAEPQIDKAEELKQKWSVELGQLWQLGEHRILCGDSTKTDDVAKVLAGDKPFLMVTDPPYGVNYDASWRADAITGGESGDMATGKVMNDDIADWTKTWEIFINQGGVVCYVWHADKYSPVVADSIYASGFELRNLIIWAKDRLSISRGNYHHQYEPCWYAVKKGESAKFTEDRTQSTLWKNIDDVTRPDELIFVAKDEAKRVYAIRGDRSTLWQIPKPTKSETGHSTQKPIECMARPIRNHESEFVFEPFSGSGTTIIACEQLGRKCRAIELNPAYVAVAIQRWADATGKTPIKL